MHTLHDKSEHRGRENTYRRIADRYWWEDMHDNIKKYVQTCEAYQRRQSQRTKKALYYTVISRL
jgi:hypothetical protein